MKIIDHAIDYVTNRVLDRIGERKPKSTVHVNNFNIADDYARASEMLIKQNAKMR